MTNNDVKLKPCPFCGGEAVLNTCSRLSASGCSDTMGCGANVGIHLTPERAIKAWNARASDQLLKQAVGALGKISALASSFGTEKNPINDALIEICDTAISTEAALTTYIANHERGE